MITRIKTGPTLEDICRLAADRGVYISIGVAKENVGRHPPRITLQVSLPPPTNKPAESFMMDMHRGNASLNRALGMALGDLVDRQAPKKMTIIHES